MSIVGGERVDVLDERCPHCDIEHKSNSSMRTMACECVIAVDVAACVVCRARVCVCVCECVSVCVCVCV